MVGGLDCGVILLVFAVLVFGVVGICGLAIDLGQMYVAKGELQLRVPARPALHSPLGQAVGNPPAGSYLTSVNGQKLIGCQGDMTNVPAFQPGETSASQRGYIDLGNLDPIGAGGGAALIRDAVLGRVSFNLQIVPFQYVVNPEPGQKQTITSAMLERVLQDTDPTTATYYTSPQTATNTPSADVMNETMRTAYNTVTLPRPPNGNARRIASVPINNPLRTGDRVRRHRSAARPLRRGSGRQQDLRTVLRRVHRRRYEQRHAGGRTRRRSISNRVVPLAWVKFRVQSAVSEPETQVTGPAQVTGQRRLTRTEWLRQGGARHLRSGL